MTWLLGDTVYIDMLKVSYIILTVTICTESKIPSSWMKIIVTNLGLCKKKIHLLENVKVDSNFEV